MPLSLTSPDLRHGGRIPVLFTCDGRNVSPEFEWSGVPNGTRCLLLSCLDPDAPSGTFHHWTAYNIPPTKNGLPQGLGHSKQEKDFAQAINDFGHLGYDGPCPPHGHRPHAYHFRLSALKALLEGLPGRATCAKVIELAQPLEIDACELVGYYGR